MDKTKAKRENKEIEIVHLGDKQGCIFDDIIQITISPRWIDDIAMQYKDKALKSNDYGAQGLFREKADFFSEALNKWREMRHKNDEKNE